MQPSWADGCGVLPSRDPQAQRKDGRPSDNLPTSVGSSLGSHVQLRPASRARLPLRLAPDVNVRVATEIVGGRKIAHDLHRFRTPCCTPTVRLKLDLALPN
jgi:hypothetical protein